jgi:hypothetical protein
MKDPTSWLWLAWAAIMILTLVVAELWDRLRKAERSISSLERTVGQLMTIADHWKQRLKEAGRADR